MSSITLKTFTSKHIAQRLASGLLLEEAMNITDDEIEDIKACSSFAEYDDVLIIMIHEREGSLPPDLDAKVTKTDWFKRLTMGWV